MPGETLAVKSAAPLQCRGARRSSKIRVLCRFRRATLPLAVCVFTAHLPSRAFAWGMGNTGGKVVRKRHVAANLVICPFLAYVCVDFFECMCRFFAHSFAHLQQCDSCQASCRRRYCPGLQQPNHLAPRPLQQVSSPTLSSRENQTQTYLICKN